ncbi:acyl-CoA thioesterase 9, tandem duplicate 2 isoform X5 [Megalobrama amblycephala]|uniref:acyl-CoA thioesterase 9, tandem duplicate 2 isoform X5 n=1 Tax=Megalobrama amblycephala TaxID=75352 RepID=UPI0020140FFB|nr:acyl-CoA thioesterase 9, tandem duplicate 2 isoform X5 [Megalobrama amblycephala]
MSLIKMHIFHSSQQAERDSRRIYQLAVCYRCNNIAVITHYAGVSKIIRNAAGQKCIFSTTYRDHQQVLAERASLSQYLAQSQDELPAKRMKDSAIEAHLPLGTQPALREKYLNSHNAVRFGRILEDLDCLGVLICYSHTWNEKIQRSPLSIVTALVDKIDMRQNIIYPDCDIKFTGHVTWVGKTSIEAKMHMSQCHDGAYTDVLDATFVMVARDPENKRAAFVNPLKPEGPDEEAIFRQGEINKKRRVELSTASLLKVAPTAEERTLIHNLFLNTLDTRGCRPTPVAVDDILFQKPVEIGSLLMLSSQVCYTEGMHIQVRVHTEVLDPLTRQHSTTNVFHFTFRVEKEVPAVVPQSYGESMLYLDGKRHFGETMRNQC